MANGIKLIKAKPEIGPEMKSFINNAVIPILVREFLKKGVVRTANTMALSTTVQKDKVVQ
jgi:hypothetical protein